MADGGWYEDLPVGWDGGGVDVIVDEPGKDGVSALEDGPVEAEGGEVDDGELLGAEKKEEGRGVSGGGTGGQRGTGLGDAKPTLRIPARHFSPAGRLAIADSDRSSPSESRPSWAFARARVCS